MANATVLTVGGVDYNIKDLLSGEGLSVALQCPTSIIEKMQYIGIAPELFVSNDGYQFTTLLGDAVVDSYYWYAGQRYVQSSVSALNNAEVDLSKGIIEMNLCDYDFTTLFVKYNRDIGGVRHISLFGVAKPGVTFTQAEKEWLMKTFELSAFWDNNLNCAGFIKGDRPLGKKQYVNLVQNPGFTSSSNWTLGSTWSISGGKANCNDSSTPATQASLLQTVPLAVGKRYRLAVKIDSITSGGVVMRANWDEAVSNEITVASEYAMSFTVTGSGVHQNEIMFRPGSNGFVGSIGYVELTEL